MAHSLTRFMVLENYEMVYKNKELKWISNEDHSYKAKIKNNSIYNPLEEATELYTELNKVNIDNHKSIMKFVETYGLPLGETINAGNQDIKAFHTMNIEEFSQKLEKYKEIFGYWKITRNKVPKEMEQVKKEFGNAALEALMLSTLSIEDLEEVDHEEFGKKDSPVVIPEYARWLEIKDKEPIHAVNELVSILINEQYTKQEQTKYVDTRCVDKGKITYEKKMAPAVYFNNLFDVAYYQLLQAEYRESRIAECKNCGLPFEVTHERQRFCPPKKGLKGSTCENTYNKRIKRNRKKEKEKLEAE
jgi:hypothetical protein